MPSALPDGDPAPPDGRLPDQALAALGERPLSFYLHVPYCSTRCGYCDFNTYTADELGPGVSRATWADSAVAEIRLARSVLGEADLPVETVFVGGGTPTLLPPADLVRALDAVRDCFGLAAGAEVTTEANPDTVDPSTLQALADGGFTRVSYGMQSAVPHVLRALDRTHDPLRVPQVVEWARQAGLQTSLDLIYGAPGESDADWLASVEAAVACRPDHVSAYALVVEEGTRLAAQVRRGEVAAPDDDALADRYEAADALLASAGFAWYEVSNWATRAERAVPPQPGVLARRRLVGRRAGRPQPHPGHALVERAAPGRLGRRAGRGAIAGAGPRGAGRRGAARRDGAAGGSAGRGAGVRRPRRGGPGGRADAGGRGARGAPTPQPATAWCSRCVAGCSRTGWCGRCCPDGYFTIRQLMGYR